MSAPVDVLAVMDRCQSYVDDAAGFPEQFKPGVVKRDQSEYREARSAVAKLIEKADAALVTLGKYAEKIDGEFGDGLNLEQLLANGEESEYAELRSALARVKGA